MKNNKFKITLKYTEDGSEFTITITARNFIEAKTALKNRIGSYESEAKIIKVTKNDLPFYN